MGNFIFEYFDFVMAKLSSSQNQQAFYDIDNVLLDEQPQLGLHYLSLPPAIIKDIARNINVTPIASRTADRLEIFNVTLSNIRIRIDISMLVTGNIMREVQSRCYKNILGQNYVNIVNLFSSMHKLLRYTVQHKQNVIFRPAESIIRNYTEAQRLHRLAVSTNDDKSTKFYSNVIILLSKYIRRYASEENNYEQIQYL